MALQCLIHFPLDLRCILQYNWYGFVPIYLICSLKTFLLKEFISSLYLSALLIEMRDISDGIALDYLTAPDIWSHSFMIF